jgi:NADPH2:quinone reductase
MITKMNATVFYDAIGGEMTAKIITLMPKNSTAYIYGALEGGYVKNVPVIDLIYKNMTVKGLFLPTWL